MKVKSNATHVFQLIVPKLTLIPGINIISNDDAEAFLADSIVQAKIKVGLIEILDQTTDMESLSKNYKQLLKDIPGILDIRVLEKMKADEKRPSILKAIDAQLEMLREGRKEAE